MEIVLPCMLTAVMSFLLGMVVGSAFWADDTWARGEL